MGPFSLETSETWFYIWKTFILIIFVKKGLLSINLIQRHFDSEFSVLGTCKMLFKKKKKKKKKSEICWKPGDHGKQNFLKRLPNNNFF